MDTFLSIIGWIIVYFLAFIVISVALLYIFRRAVIRAIIFLSTKIFKFALFSYFPFLGIIEERIQQEPIKSYIEKYKTQNAKKRKSK